MTELSPVLDTAQRAQFLTLLGKELASHGVIGQRNAQYLADTDRYFKDKPIHAGAIEAALPHVLQSTFPEEKLLVAGVMYDAYHRARGSEPTEAENSPAAGIIPSRAAASPDAFHLFHLCEPMLGWPPFIHVG
jgi:hypothetical protein